ncbi:hypothetical protein Desru_3874 [Desulforamulus ruminis DSM 2154]|uniref:Arc-like DNA binding domain-containing protein n=2 Tax=Desulforamulus ruminis TaxID=1564 RepID=F6DQS7_DESRL|nr:hypothetical protein Desru_3874 [Desulforamulus ruminis DSM 2154]
MSQDHSLRYHEMQVKLLTNNYKVKVDLTLIMDQNIYKLIKQIAEEENRNFNQQVLKILKDYAKEYPLTESSPGIP